MHSFEHVPQSNQTHNEQRTKQQQLNAAAWEAEAEALHDIPGEKVVWAFYRGKVVKRVVDDLPTPNREGKTPPGVTVVEPYLVHCDPSYTGALIGAGGCTIKQLEHDSRSTRTGPIINGRVERSPKRIKTSPALERLRTPRRARVWTRRDAEARYWACGQAISRKLGDGQHLIVVGLFSAGKWWVAVD